MKEIVILSGKGGVGKSSLAAALGALLADKYRLVLADTDVDAPNLHLVFGATPYDSSDIAASEKAVIDYDLCSRCMECLDTCRFASIIGESEPVIVRYSCEGCGACAITCPVGAISIQQMVNGRINLLKAGRCYVVSGELGIGESSSGKLVDVVKKRARKEAEEREADLIITDGPPGIGCPVIASLRGADYAVLVTEPTPSALHDLQRIIEVARNFKLPIGIVLNRADMHAASRQRLLELVGENGFELLAEIPYDPLLPRALAEGRLAVVHYPDSPASRAIIGLSHTLDERVSSLATAGQESFFMFK
jgi:MinD superfamily P-loop ATPase